MTSDPLTLFDGEGPSAVQARDEAIARVEEHAPPSWMVEATRTVLRLAESRASFTSDDVWEVVGSPPEPRALGAVMQRLSREGKIRATQEWRQSVRPECHARPVRVWQKGSR
jgi:hypothetical protein